MAMPSGNYLLELTAKLAAGLARLPADFRERHVSYLRAGQNADGGFSGREGESDLYYTGFGLRSLAVLDALTPEICDRSGNFLRHSLSGQASVVDFFSLLYSCALIQLGGGPDVLAESAADWPERVASTLESFRTPDGGYGKAIGDRSGSTYHTFLVGLSYQMLGFPWSQVQQVCAFVQSRRRDDGGFVELAAMRRGGTNPTAAALGVLQILAESAEVLRENDLQEIRSGVISFLANMQSAEGGLRANDRAPVADLLSTFTGTWTLRQLDALDRLDREGVRRYVQSLELPGGGFRAGLWDNRADVEYTFYGLGSLVILS
jgi:geranylgeranyl transferase type-2 subunit beta